MTKKLAVQLSTILVVLICIFLSFSRLTTLEVRMWDEARNAVNAFEMLESGFSLMTTYDWKPDHWNTKPPLLIWIQSLFMAIGGLSELTIRLPSVLAGLAFIPILISLGKRWRLGKSFSLFSLLCLFCFPIFLFVHTFRTGDYDALLTLNMFSYAIFYYLYLEYEKRSYFVGFFICLFLAALTKGIAGFLFLPGLLIITIIEKKLRFILGQKASYIGLISVFAGMFAYYFGRESIDPGYWQAVVNNELGGRFLDTTERHWQPWYFYMHYLRVEGLRFFFYSFPIVAFFALLESKTRRYALFSLILILSHLLVISIGQTKLYWYCLPEIPFIALIFGLGFKAIRCQMQAFDQKRWLSWMFPLIFLGIPIFDTFKTIGSTGNLDIERHEYFIARFLIENMDDPSLLQQTKVLVRHYYGHVRIYVEQAEDKGLALQLSKPEKLEVGDKVLLSDHGLIQQLKDRYILEHVKQEYGAQLFQITGEKSLD